MTLIWSCYYLISVILQMTIYTRKKTTTSWAQSPETRSYDAKVWKDHCSIEGFGDPHHSEVETTRIPLIAVCMEHSAENGLVRDRTKKPCVTVAELQSFCLQIREILRISNCTQTKLSFTDSNLSSTKENGSWSAICSKFTKKTLEQHCGWMKARFSVGGRGSVMWCF